MVRPKSERYGETPVVSTYSLTGFSLQVKGTWRELTDNVNAMAANLTDQVRNIATVTTAVAQGDLSRKVSANCKGEILKLKETINKMVDRLQNFATEVTKVAR